MDHARDANASSRSSKRRGSPPSGAVPHTRSECSRARPPGRFALRQPAASVDNRDDVFEVMTGEIVTGPASVKSLQLGCNEVDRGDAAKSQPGQFDVLGRFHGGQIPTVGEAQDFLVNRHHVYRQVSGAPSAGRRTFTSILNQAKLQEPVRQRTVFRVRVHRGDHVNVGSGPRSGDSRVGDHEPGHTPADEHDFTEQRLQRPRRSFQQPQVWVPRGPSRGRHGCHNDPHHAGECLRTFRFPVSSAGTRPCWPAGRHAPGDCHRAGGRGTGGRNRRRVFGHRAARRGRALLCRALCRLPRQPPEHGESQPREARRRAGFAGGFLRTGQLRQRRRRAADRHLDPGARQAERGADAAARTAAAD